jgi:hypothetical protein
MEGQIKRGFATETGFNLKEIYSQGLKDDTILCIYHQFEKVCKCCRGIINDDTRRQTHFFVRSVTRFARQALNLGLQYVMEIA